MRANRNVTRIRKGIWKSRGAWQPVYVYDQHQGSGAQYQHYMVAADGSLVCAGVTRHERMNQAIANQIFRVWRRWRHEYDTQFDGKGREYPARHCAMPTHIQVFPIDSPDKAEWFTVAKAEGGAL